MRAALPLLCCALLGLGCSGTVIVIDGDDDPHLGGRDPRAGCTQDLWSRAISGTEGPSAAAIAAGAGCSTVVVGTFRGAADYGEGSLGSVGGTDVLVMKLGSAGDVRWSRALGGEYDEQGIRVGMSPEGTVVVAGHGGTEGTSGPTTAFVTWLGEGGKPLRTIQLGEFLSPVRITGMAVDRGGATVITGYYQGSVDFGGEVMDSAGLDDIFVARYEPDGSLGFVRSFGDADHQSGAGGVAVDGEGAIYATGGFRGTVDFGGGPVTNPGDEDVYVIKLGPAGETIWARTFGDLGHQKAAPIAVSEDGRVALAGSFEGAVDFGGGPMQSTEGHHFNLFVAQLDAEGAHRWSRRFGDVDAEEAVGLGFAPEGHLVLAGHFGGSLAIGDQAFETNGAWDLFAARFDGAGTPVASRQFGDHYAQRCEGVAVDARGQVLLTGSFEGSLDLGEGPLVAAEGDADAFVARLSL